MREEHSDLRGHMPKERKSSVYSARPWPRIGAGPKLHPPRNRSRVTVLSKLSAVATGPARWPREGWCPTNTSLMTLIATGLQGLFQADCTVLQGTGIGTGHRSEALRPS